MKAEKILILMFLLLLPSVISFGNYTEKGGLDLNYALDSGLWNNLTTDPQVTSRGVTTPNFIPLVADLDNNGQTEIVIIDGNNVELYQRDTLTLIDTYLSPEFTSSDRAYMILFDIDDDGLIEIIMTNQQNADIEILEWNGTDLFLQQNIGVSGHSLDGEVMLGCESANNCLLVEINNNVCNSGVNNILYTHSFNSTSRGPRENTFQTGTTGCNYLCLPKGANMPVVDRDQDGDLEYVITFMFADDDSGQTEAVRIFFVNSNISLNNTVDSSIAFTVGDLGDIAQGDCANNLIGRKLTNAVVQDFEIGGGLETAIGYMIDEDEFNIAVYDAGGSEIDAFPSIQDAQGELVSNLFIMDDNEGFNMCVLGFNENDTTINACNSGQCLHLLCGSLTDTFDIVGPFNPDNIEYVGDVGGIFNLSSNYFLYNELVHVGDYSSATETTNTDDIVTTYGVHNADFDSCSTTTAFCDLFAVFNIDGTFGIQDGAVIPVDPFNVGRNQFLMYTSANLFYLTDNFPNNPAEISQIETNPCIDAVIQVNETLFVSVTTVDDEGDLVTVNVTVYGGEPNEQTESLVNISSNVEVSFSFNLNQTTGSSTLLTSVVDTENPFQPDTDLRTFTVGTQGVQFNDCSSTFTLELAEEVEAEFIAGTTISTDNSLTTSVQTIADEFGFNLAIVWIILMTIIAGAMFMGGIDAKFTESGTIGIVLLVQILMLILGTILGFLSIGILIVIIILGIIAISFWIRKQFTSTPMG